MAVVSGDITMYFNASNIWECFQNYKEQLSRSQLLICENTKDKTQIYITEDVGCPLFIVYQYGRVLSKEPAINETDSQNTYRVLFVKYICSSYLQSKKENADKILGLGTDESDDPVEEDIYAELDAEISDRDEMLFQAMQDALLVVLGVPDIDRMYGYYGDDIVEDCIDILCRGLAKEHQISVYRPTWERDKKTKKEVFVRRPYLDLGDENDPPIYRDSK